MRDETASTSFPSQADVEREENVTPRSRGIEAGDVAIEMDDLHTLLANEPKNISPDAAIAGDLQILNTVSGEITKRRLLSTDTRGGPCHLKLRENEIVREFGFGPKPESLHFRKSDHSHGITPRWYEPRVELDPNPTTLTRWKLALSVMQDHQELWEQYKARCVFKDTLVDSSKVLQPDVRAWEYPASLLTENFVDSGIQNWPGKDLLGQADTLVPNAILSLATAGYGGLHAAAWHAFSHSA
ncbi:MAG: hypothetical protein ASARMPREDX12_007902 [Alectoria sarmentosa]|nr:MAG: hypothetical protein ASARMPREDX12_007902 [Alectoria sarmentosa]